MGAAVVVGDGVGSAARARGEAIGNALVLDATSTKMIAAMVGRRWTADSRTRPPRSLCPSSQARSRPVGRWGRQYAGLRSSKGRQPPWRDRSTPSTQPGAWGDPQRDRRSSLRRMQHGACSIGCSVISSSTRSRSPCAPDRPSPPAHRHGDHRPDDSSVRSGAREIPAAALEVLDGDGSGRLARGCSPPFADGGVGMTADGRVSHESAADGRPSAASLARRGLGNRGVRVSPHCGTLDEASRHRRPMHLAHRLIPFVPTSRLVPT